MKMPISKTIIYAFLIAKSNIRYLCDPDKWEMEHTVQAHNPCSISLVPQ